MQNETKSSNRTPTGLPAIGDVPWGAHLCHFYREQDDLESVLVPYFRTGLQRGEQCLWITCHPLEAERARQALSEAVPDLQAYEERGQIEILDYSDWYTATGDMDLDEVLEMWKAREREAKQRGYRGLRLTGNTFWLEREDWEEFAAYEAAIHELFHERDILALCSYSLDRCSIDDVLDVLRTHEFALLNRDGTSEVISSATQLIGMVDEPIAPPDEHVVHLYSDGMFPAEAIGRFLAEGLETGNPAAAIATRPHLDAIRTAVEENGADPEEVDWYEARDLLSDFTRDGVVDLEIARPRVRQMLEEMSRKGEPHIYGEMVDVLARRQGVANAVRLEKLWNQELQRWPTELYCSYQLSESQSDDAIATCMQICGEHGDVRVDATPRDQTVVATSLARELRRRRDADALREASANASANRTNRQLAGLQRVTSALSEVQSLEQMKSVLERDRRAVLGAQNVLVIVSRHDGEFDALVEAGTDDPAGQVETEWCQKTAPEALQHDRARWLRSDEIEDELGTSSDAGALACVPMYVGGRAIGVAAFCFGTDQAFDARQRALIEDIAAQIAVTVDRIQLYEEARRQRERAERGSKAKDEFLAMLGHELRNPLAAIQSASEVLKLKSQDSHIQRTQAILERQTEHMARLLDGLLDVSRIVRGKIAFEQAPVNVTEIARSVVQDRLASQSPDANLELNLAVDEIWVEGDHVRLTQVLDNLIANAIKFSEPGERITVGVRRERDVAVIEVCDEGIGIESELIDHIFEPFEQGADFTRTDGGLGLGLALVKRLVELHGGEVSAHSSGPGEGAQFEIRLSAIEPPDVTEAQESSNLNGSLRTLLVEDNRDVAELLSTLLSALGHQTRVAHDGKKALDLLAEYHPEVILCDIGLHGELSGYDFARRVRESGDHRVRLVAVTGYGGAEDVRRATDAGFDHHLTKPVSTRELTKILQGVRA